MKSSSKMLQNFVIFYTYEFPNMFFPFCATLFFSLMKAAVYVDIDQGIHQGKNKVAQNEKRKKLHAFSYSKSMANFE